MNIRTKVSRRKATRKPAAPKRATRPKSAIKSRKKVSLPKRAAAAPRVRKRILLVDDHPFMRAGMAQLINGQPDLSVCGEAANPVEAFAAIAKLRPDMILTDLSMPGRSGLEFVKDLIAMNSKLLVLVISMHDESVYAERALRAGARGYIMKEAGGENLLAAVRHVLSGQVHVSPKLSARILDGMSGTRPRSTTSLIAELTDRQFEIFQLVGQGKSTRDIAEQLHLSPKTVDVHRGHIKAKLALKNATALMRHAVRWVETPGMET